MAAARREVIVFIVDAGGGHRSAAEALVVAAERRACSWRFRIVSLEEVLGSFDALKALTGRSIEETYNTLLRRRWTRPLSLLLRVLQGLIVALRGPLASRLTAYLSEHPADLVVSLAPNFNGVIRDAVRAVEPRTPFFVVLTDYADLPPHFWIEPGLDRVVVATERAALQAQALGIPPEKISRTSGMILHPRFYPRSDGNVRLAVRAELGIAEEDLVVLLLFGGKGSAEVEPLSRLLLEAHPGWHVIAICGDNPRLYERLGPVERGSGGRLHRLAFTQRVAEYMAGSDLLVTKPGPGSLAEALHQRLPVVVSCDAYTIPQERFNALMVGEERLGVVVHGWREIPPAAAALAQDEPTRAAILRRLEALPENRATDEVLDIVERGLDRS